MKARILFLCTGNSARSQIAEGLARALAAPGVEVMSAGTRPTGLNPLAVEAMRERGLDISGQRSKRVDEVPGEFDYVITLCDGAAESCPDFPATRRKLHWSLPDPAAATGGQAERLMKFREVREEVERRLRGWLGEERLLAAEPSGPLVERVRRELAKYEHPLFDFEARPAGDSVEVQIRFRPPGVDVHAYFFQLHPREIECGQFPWTFQKQLYDCLHDYVIEMWTRNPQRED